MNFDLITKLAKLANNNPSENEANAAARKVCKLLAEGEFKFTPDSVKTPFEPPLQGKSPVTSPHQSVWDIINDLNKKRYAEEAETYRGRWTKAQEEFFGGQRGGGKTKTNEDGKYEAWCIVCNRLIFKSNVENSNYTCVACRLGYK